MLYLKHDNYRVNCSGMSNYTRYNIQVNLTVWLPSGYTARFNIPLDLTLVRREQGEGTPASREHWRTVSSSASVSVTKRLMPTTTGTPNLAQFSMWRCRLQQPARTSSVFSVLYSLASGLPAVTCTRPAVSKADASRSNAQGSDLVTCRHVKACIGTRGPNESEPTN